MDKLQTCAKLFYNMLDIQYLVKIGRKGHLIEMCISFSKKDFHHLIGLQKLEDNDYIRTTDRSKIFDNILDGNITYETIQKSDFFDKMSSRIEPFLQFELFLDSNDIIFNYSKKKNIYSKIDADYLMVNILDEKIVYLFIDKSKDSDNYFCRTFFPKDSFDYTINQTKYKLLYKEKINIRTGENYIQLDKLSKP